MFLKNKKNYSDQPKVTVYEYNYEQHAKIALLFDANYLRICK